MIIDIDVIKAEGLKIKEYLNLKFLFCRDQKIDDEFTQNYGEISDAELVRLASMGWIHQSSGTIELRDKTRNLFEGKKDYFYTWLVAFPIKTPSGRYLSVKSPDSIAAVKLKKKWDKHFKNNASGAKRAIAVLEAELAWRRQTGKFEFMHNAETWLNQCDYEKYEYLIEDKMQMDSKIKEDFS